MLRNLHVIPSSSKMTLETLRLQSASLYGRVVTCKQEALAPRSDKKKKQIRYLSVWENVRWLMRCLFCKPSRNASFSLSLPFYFNQSLSFSLSLSFPSLFPFLSLSSFSVTRCPSPTRHLRSLHQAPISRAYRFAYHPVGGRSNQSRSRRAARPFSNFLRRPC